MPTGQLASSSFLGGGQQLGNAASMALGGQSTEQIGLAAVMDLTQTAAVQGNTDKAVNDEAAAWKGAAAYFGQYVHATDGRYNGLLSSTSGSSSVVPRPTFLTTDVGTLAADIAFFAQRLGRILGPLHEAAIDVDLALQAGDKTRAASGMTKLLANLIGPVGLVLTGNGLSAAQPAVKAEDPAPKF